MMVWLCNVQAFEQDLDKCEKGVAAIQKAARDIIEKSAEDVSKYQDQLVDLQTKWDKVCRLSGQKSERLDQAMGEAESFERKTYALLNWLRDAEHQLRYQGPLPDDEAALVDMMTSHKVTQQHMLSNLL